MGRAPASSSSPLNIGKQMVNSRFYDGLLGDDAPVLSLYEDLLSTGAHIECFPGGVSPHSGNGGVLAAADWHRHEGVWRVYFPTTAHAHQVYHELLHVHFQSVECAPVMLAVLSTEPLRRNVEELNNDFDHAHVVPLEVEKYPEACVYWEKDFVRLLGTIPPSSADRTMTAQRKLDLLRAWLILPVAMPSAPITRVFRAELVKENWLATADAMTAQVQSAGADKARSVQAFRDALGIDYPPTSLVIFSHASSANSGKAWFSGGI
jgi:hypothetical protein